MSRLSRKEKRATMSDNVILVVDQRMPVVYEVNVENSSSHKVAAQMNAANHGLMVLADFADTAIKDSELTKNIPGFRPLLPKPPPAGAPFLPASLMIGAPVAAATQAPKRQYNLISNGQLPPLLAVNRVKCQEKSTVSENNREHKCKACTPAEELNKPSTKKVDKEKRDSVLDENLKKPHDKNYSRYCSIPNCWNSKERSPEKHIFKLPRTPLYVRSELHNRLSAFCTPNVYRKKKATYTGTLLVCQDHFYLEEDVVDLESQPWELKRGVFPKKIVLVAYGKDRKWVEFDMQAYRDQQQRAYEASRPAKEEIESEPEEISDGPDTISDYAASESWEDDLEDFDETNLCRIAAKAAATGKTMKTRRDTKLENLGVEAEKFDEGIAGFYINARPEDEPDIDTYCFHCAREFETRPATITHLNHKHPYLAPFACTHCSFKCYTFDAYCKHMHCHSLMADNNMCKRCNRVFKTQEDLENHVRGIYYNTKGKRKKLKKKRPRREETEETALAVEGIEAEPSVEEDMANTATLETEPAVTAPEDKGASTETVSEIEKLFREVADNTAFEMEPDDCRMDPDAEMDLADTELEQATVPVEGAVIVGVPCPKCPELLESEQHLVVHLVNHGLIYHCDYCPETIQEWPNIYQHMLSHLGSGFKDVPIIHSDNKIINPSSIF